VSFGDQHDLTLDVQKRLADAVTAISERQKIEEDEPRGSSAISSRNGDTDGDMDNGERTRDASPLS